MMPFSAEIKNTFLCLLFYTRSSYADCSFMFLAFKRLVFNLWFDALAEINMKFELHFYEKINKKL